MTTCHETEAISTEIPGGRSEARNQTGALCLPRGNGKSYLAGYLGADALTPGGALFEAGAENVLLSGSFDQARYVFRFAKDFLGEAGYSYLDSTNKLAIRHKESGTRLLVRSSRAKGAFGIVGARIAIAEEPGAWDTLGGSMMADALDTSLGKPGNRSHGRLHRNIEPKSRWLVASVSRGWIERKHICNEAARRPQEVGSMG